MTDCYDNSVTCCTIFCIISISNNYGPSDICLFCLFLRWPRCRIRFARVLTALHLILTCLIEKGAWSS